MTNSSTAIKTVPFHGHDLITIQDGETVRVAMKPICDAIGLQWQAQFNRIKRHAVLSQGVSIMNIPSNGGIQQFTTLPIEMLNGWLFGVDSNRVKPEIREHLLMYQRECFQALASYWQKGVAINPRIPLTPDHQRGIQKAVARRAQALPKGLQRLAYSRLYSHLKDRFDVAKYDQIPDEQYTQALAAIETFELEGEWMPAPEQAVEQGVSLTDTQAQNMLAALSHLLDINRIYEQYSLYEHLTGLGSPAGVKLHDHIKDGRLIARHLISKLENELLLVRARLGLPYRSLLH